MEVMKDIQASFKKYRLRMAMVLVLLIPNIFLYAQQDKAEYSIKHGGLEIILSKALKEPKLDQFIKQHNLQELSLKELIRNNFRDSVNSHGWKIELNNNELLVMTKPLFSVNNLADPTERFLLTGNDNGSVNSKNPVPMNGQSFGYNVFRNVQPFAIKDSAVTFLLRKFSNAKKVFLAGSFTTWADNALPMKRTDSGWVVRIKLLPGKYTYKFIADGNWLTDPDNATIENDGEGNNNSVFYVTNYTFRLNGFGKAKRIIVSGSFNNWHEKQLRMIKTEAGWELPVYLNTGTYTYRFIVDGDWITDPANPNRAGNEFDDYNSIVSIGKPTLFVLRGYKDAQKVFLAGSFNGWRNFELPMTRTATGWQIPYVLGAGNYEYKFFVDGRWINAAGEPLRDNAAGSTLVIEPNYTFHLKKFAAAKNVFLAGDFNGWSPNAQPMQKKGEEWIVTVHLSPGKHVYKFVADGEWIKDPGNKLWEENEFGTGNSVLWIE